jgi:histone acetyltransferase (RNA polymerase elongator complex component)
MNARPFIVPVFIPHAGCPHRCVFCNQSVITGRLEKPQGPDEVLASARTFLQFRRRRPGPAQLAFFGGNFLGLPLNELRCLLDTASKWVSDFHLDGIRFSTRPDTVQPGTLDLIGAYPVKCVELGVQSMDDDVLRQSRRGHTAADTEAAVRRLRERRYTTGIQLMVGLPGDGEAGLLETGRRVAELGPAFVRIYPTLVLEGSPLASWYRNGRYHPPSLQQAVDLCMKLYRFLRQRRIDVIRTGLQPTEELAYGRGVIAGPFHPAFGDLVQSACCLDAIQRELRCRPISGPTLELRVHPTGISRARGQRNGNCAALSKEFGFTAVRVVPDTGLGGEMIALEDGRLINPYASQHRAADGVSVMAAGRGAKS